MIRILVFGLASAVTLFGQHRFSWQDACFNNPAAPYCMGHEDAIKRNAPGKDPSNKKDLVTNPLSSSAAPPPLVVGGIDWRFADPLADALAGFDLHALSASSVARGLIAQWAATEGLTEADLKKKFDGLAGVERVAFSIRDSSVLMMVVGQAVSTPPALDAGWKSVSVSGNAILIGHADAVDEAVQRLATKDASLSELTRLSQERQAQSELWVVGLGRFLGPQAESAGLKRFGLAASMRNLFVGDMAFEFNQAPGTNTVPFWPALGGATIEGNVIHNQRPIPADEMQQKFGQIASSTLGQRLTALFATARYLPVRDIESLKRTKPVIYGLDSGPKVVN